MLKFILISLPIFIYAFNINTVDNTEKSILKAEAKTKALKKQYGDYDFYLTEDGKLVYKPIIIIIQPTVKIIQPTVNIVKAVDKVKEKKLRAQKKKSEKRKKEIKKQFLSEKELPKQQRVKKENIVADEEVTSFFNSLNSKKMKPVNIE